MKLKSLGQSGLLAYGFLNIAYYVSITSISWFAFSKPDIAQHPSFRIRLSQTTVKLGKVMAVVWAGSQVTMLPRLTISIALSPLVDRYFAFVERNFKSMKNRQQIFNVTVAALLGFAALFYLLLIAGDVALSAEP